MKPVPGHAGKLLFGLLEAERRPVVLMVGRLQSVSLRCCALRSASLKGRMQLL